MADYYKKSIELHARLHGKIETVKQIAPVFGGVNLEDISALRCFEIVAALEILEFRFSMTINMGQPS